MTNKKNNFLRFVFSLLPGAGEMYMGFMKMGVSLMGLFFLIIAVAVTINLGPLMFLIAIVWFYSFFHVHNLASLSDEEFYAVEDEYLFYFDNIVLIDKKMSNTYRTVIAIVLIVIGVILTGHSVFNILMDIFPAAQWLWTLYSMLRYDLPRILVGIAIILLGILMIRGKKQQLEKEIEKEEKFDFELEKTDEGREL